MNLKNSIFLLLIFSFGLVFSQNPKSRADDYFFEYDFENAVLAYETDIADGFLLTPKQRLNLADSYFRTDSFDKASNLYVELFTQDSIMDNLQFNRMLQSLSKSSEDVELKAFIDNQVNGLTKELLENADFNNKMFADAVQNELGFKIFNLSANSEQSDFSATFYKEGVLFTSGRPNPRKKDYQPAGESYLDIYYGEMDELGFLKSAELFSGVEKTEYHKATPYFSEDLGSYFYVLSNTEGGELAFDENGKNSLAIGYEKEGGDFQFLLKDLSTSFYYPYYHKETDRLYFAADFENGYGGTDIYFVYTNKGQVMSAPINLGPRINSPGNEISPYIFENSLYFSSDIFYGIGGMDIYKSNINGDSFSIPVNLGPQINSDEDDFGFIIKNYHEGLLGYFSSNRPGGKGKDDIYGFMVDEKPGFQTFALNGKVVKLSDYSGISEATVRAYDENGQLLQEVVSDVDGNYSLEVPWQNAVRLEATKSKYSIFSLFLNEDKMKSQQQKILNMGIAYYDDLVEEQEGQTVVKLNKFYFDKNQTKITEAIAIELNKVVDAVQRFPAIQLRIETHTDSRGSSTTNFKLSQKRSDNIKKYLVQQGVPESNILYSVGYGEDKILNNCKNGVYCIDFLHKENQRSLIVVLNDNILFE
ncbi:OmpA family protein [Croceivirga thetidis]|uniref:OmpA family protein n=1 Tax=Croceivirga thetidis TaxID=2721623 RepID=A0ABX1GL23_9FLAO|nr:OmpA family protein [Croceivirga thetidis]NKI30593.1 OmpA family protein [Croceivirga thetidis]